MDKDARIKELEDALRPFAAYAKARQRMPIPALGDSVHTIHGGTEWEASIAYADCIKALTVLGE